MNSEEIAEAYSKFRNKQFLKGELTPEQVNRIATILDFYIKVKGVHAAVEVADIVQALNRFEHEEIPSES